MGNKRVMVSEYGGPEKLQIHEEPLRPSQPHEVRIRVHSAGVALGDVMRREGKFLGGPATPFTPGYEAVGFVDEVGERIKGIPKGSRGAVFYNGAGGYAQYVYATADEFYPVPEGVDMGKAVAVILNYVTAYQMLHRVAKVVSGDQILIHGASGGTGTALLELGRLAGLRMYGTASAPKHDIVAGYGAVPIDYRSEDFVQLMRSRVPDGVDAVFDPIGGSHWVRSFQTLNKKGHFVGYGYTSVLEEEDSSEWAKNWTYLMTNQTTPQGNPACLYSITTLRKERPDWFREDLAHLFHLLVEARIDPVIAERIPLTEAVRAHQLLETSQTAGKIVLTNPCL
ncbi:medium chain dehydrogenase/reductase family protein [Paenibacillus aurantius]|uniref:Medium chain dehydrogenase/reductase family protein n=1 Tax=Paenibacillus aurantius TaxID=2918900 RepID=A0AA96L8V7_9BACL|nr:medium chain dehydrogenase/reductase family protein [Paenibacillus aurantius]WNQ08820.1 medium chain dehydrogenase/reductase family protein [Paenibacillus aurantius]